jgi:hypothetical protein
MEVLVIGAMFFGIILAGGVLAAVLVLRAVRADQHYVDRFEQTADVTPHLAWVQPQAAAA